MGDIEYYKDRNGWTGKIKYQETFVVEILMIDSYGNCFNKISEKFSGNGYNHSGSKLSKRSAKMEVEYRFYRICHIDISKELYQRLYQTLITNVKLGDYLFYLQSLKTLQKTNINIDSSNNYILWTNYFCENKSNT